MSTVLIVILVLLLFGVIPGVGYIPHHYGYYPVGGLGLVLIILLILLITGKI